MTQTIKKGIAIGCAVLLSLGFVLTFYLAWKAEGYHPLFCVAGLALGFILSPIVHELGHIVVGKCVKMQCVYAKLFCVRYQNANGEKRLSFASIFDDDQTQVVPKHGENMKTRTLWYVLGGLLFNVIFLILTIICALITAKKGQIHFLFWGVVPHCAYLVLLNALPVEYSAGKTDALVFLDVQKETDAGKNMLSAMEIQGRVYAGESFGEINENLYNTPQLAEDEPLFAVMTDVKYRYYLEKGDLQKASECINRLAQIQAYLSEEEVQKVAGELVYMHSVLGNIKLANECQTLCEEYLEANTVTANRILAAFCKAEEERSSMENYLATARGLLPKESMAGVRKFEEILLARIEQE